MPAQTLAEFVNGYEEKDVSAELFELENEHMLEVRLNGSIWAKAGAMVARDGQVKFTRQGVLEQGLGNLLKKAVSGEGMVLMKIEGQGRVYLAGAGKKITLLRLAGDQIFVNGNDVLAFETGVASQITMMKRVAGMLSGGLFNVKLSGRGSLPSHRIIGRWFCERARPEDPFSPTRMRPSHGPAGSRRRSPPTSPSKHSWAEARAKAYR